MLCSNESRFNLLIADGQNHVYRRTGKNYADCVVGRDLFDGVGRYLW